MARKPMTEEQKAARTAKMKATKAANKSKALQELGLKTVRKKVRKPRKMTEEQKAAAITRLAKAREARGPSQNKMIAESVKSLPDENPLSLANVKEWIRENKDMLKSIKVFKDSKDSKERDRYSQVETYVANLEAYLRDGTYRDWRYGSQMQSKITYKVTHMAYYPDGTPKRMVGALYSDCGVYTQEMAEEENAKRKTISNKK